MTRIDVIVQKSKRSSKIAEIADVMNISESVLEFHADTDIADASDSINEVQIDVGNQIELKSHIAELLLTFLELENRTKDQIDFSYTDLDAKLRRSRIQEKKLITDYLRDLDNDERKVEDTKKALKLGRWNVGMQKGLVDYDAATYERERNEMIARLNNEPAVEDEGELFMDRDIDDLERDERDDEDADADREAYDIQGLDEDYNDGVYYNEDAEENM
jgi:hypothetical protein